MATLKQIQFKRSKTAGARPAASVLAEGELAINLKDRTLFTKDDAGQIIDLGFAKGGQVDGDVTINGKLTLNGAYVQTLAGINTTGGINAGASISATTYYARGGSFYARSPDANTNTHVWFENTDGGERGVIWAAPNTSALGQVKIRAKTTAGVSVGDYIFRSDGQFDVPVAVKIGGAAMLTKDGNITSGSMFGGNLNNYLTSIKNDIVAGDNKQVSKTGDTMTGNLTINANLKVENPNGTFVDLGSETSDKYSRLTLARKIGDGAGVAMLKVTPEGNVQFGYQPTVATPSPTKYILIKPNGLEVEGDLVFKQTYRGVEEAFDISGQTIDLNSLIIRGSDLGTRKLYTCRSSGGGSNILNKPTSDGNFTLEVLSLRKISDTDWSCKQTFTTKNNNVVGVYVRYGQGGSWSAWKEVVSGVQPINLGGTGATSVAAARNNLGVGAGQTVTFGNLVTTDLTANGNVRLVGRLNFGSNSQSAGVLRANEGGAVVLSSASGANIHIRADGDTSTGETRFEPNGNVVVGGAITASGRITVNAATDAIVVNAPTQASSNYIQGRKAGVAKWYVGIGDGGDAVRLHNNVYYHGIGLSADTVDITKPLKVGNAQLGTDGNITSGSGNFANLNTTLNRKVNSGFITYGATAGWYKFATVTMPQSTSTVFFKIAGGSGFNSGLFTQCNIAEIVLRTSNQRPADLNAVLYTRTIATAFRNIAVNNVSGDTYDIYVYAGTYCNQLTCEWSCTENATVSVIGINSSTQSPVDALPGTAVNGQVANVLNNLVDRGKVKRYEADSEIAINSPTGIRIRSNGDKTGSVATMLRNDGGSFYILFTDKNATDGEATVNGDWNSKRPFAINLTTGEVSMNNGIAVRSAALFYNSINVKDNGSINFDKSGDNPRNMRIFHAGNASRGNRIEIADETNYIAYFEKAPGGANRFVVNNATVSGVNQMNSFGVNTSNALGGNSITFGDNDTGIKQNGDGLLDIYANSAQVFRFQNGDLYSYKNINAPNVYIRSDIRLKSNFKPIENALDKVEKLNGVIYDKAEYIGGDAIETEAGIVAQTLQDVLPEAVRETEDSKGNKILTVSSQAQIALLVEAVKTLSARVKELESKLM